LGLCFFLRSVSQSSAAKQTSSSLRPPGKSDIALAWKALYRACCNAAARMLLAVEVSVSVARAVNWKWSRIHAVVVDNV
jgi:hypothetical protein